MAIDESALTVASMTSMTKGKGHGKGKGMCGPPPPKALSAAERAAAKEAAEQRKEEDKKKREERQAKQRAEADAQQALQARLPTMKSCNIFSDIPWHSAKLSVNIAGGKENSGFSFPNTGIKVVELENDNVVCLRRVYEIVNEFIAENVAIALNIPVARTRLVRPDESEFEEIENMTKRIAPDRGWEYTMPGSSMLRQMKKDNPKAQEQLMMHLGRRSSVAVLEFVPGVTLDCAQQVQHDPGTWLHRDAWVTMGRICVLDMLLNNMDRLPLPVFDNREGNLGNIMVALDGRNVVGIDQQVNPIGNDVGRTNYIERVRSLVKEILMSSNTGVLTDSPMAKKMSEAIREAVGAKCNIVIPDSATSFLLQGFRSALFQVSDKWTSGELADALDSMHHTAMERIVVSQAFWEGDADGAWSDPVIIPLDDLRGASCVEHVRLVSAEISSIVRQSLGKS